MNFGSVTKSEGHALTIFRDFVRATKTITNDQNILTYANSKYFLAFFCIIGDLRALEDEPLLPNYLCYFRVDVSSV